MRRPLTLSLDQLRSWIGEASPHVKLALAIGALAPKLRLTNILGLRWDTSFDDDLKFITIADHKTDRSSGFAMVVPISPQLRDILEAAQAAGNGPHVIQFRGRPVASIKTALRNAARRANMPYGLRARGATFHTLRHLAATMLAELRVPEALRKETMGHKEIRTTQIYTHLRPVHQVEPLEQLSNATPLADLLPSPTPRPTGTAVPHRDDELTSLVPTRMTRQRLFASAKVWSMESAARHVMERQSARISEFVRDGVQLRSGKVVSYAPFLGIVPKARHRVRALGERHLIHRRELVGEIVFQAGLNGFPDVVSDGLVAFGRGEANAAPCFTRHVNAEPRQTRMCGRH